MRVPPRWLPSGGGLAGFLAGVIFAIMPGMVISGLAVMAGGWMPVIGFFVVTAGSVAIALAVRRLVNRHFHRKGG